MDAITVAGLNAEMLRISDLLDRGIEALRVAANDYAEAEDAYRLALARAYMRHDGPAHERKFAADLATSAERRAAHCAEGLKVAALEAVRSRRAQLSALQSIAAAHRAEAEFTRTAGGLTS